MSYILVWLKIYDSFHFEGPKAYMRYEGGGSNALPTPPGITFKCTNVKKFPNDLVISCVKCLSCYFFMAIFDVLTEAV